MIRKLKGKEELISKIVPRDFAVGCRVRGFSTLQYATDTSQRPTPGNGYLECLTDEKKVHVTFSHIREITEHGVVTDDGVLHELDVLVCATGFDVTFRPRFPVVGEDGLDLRDAWKVIPDTYLSATIPKFPNYFSKSPAALQGQYILIFHFSD